MSGAFTAHFRRFSQGQAGAAGRPDASPNPPRPRLIGLQGQFGYLNKVTLRSDPHLFKQI